MLSTEEQRLLRQIEHGLHHDDPWFGVHLSMVRIRELRSRRGVRVCLLIELTFVALAVVGGILALPALVAIAVSAAVLLPMAAWSYWLAPSPPADAPPLPPTFGIW